MNTPPSRVPHPGGYEQVTVAGQTVKFTRINSGIREDFAAWVQEQAYARLEKSKPRLSREEYARRLRNLDDKVDAGSYDWGFPMDGESCGSGVWKSRNEGEGPARLAQMLLREHQPNITAKDIAALFLTAEEEAIETGQPNKVQLAMNRALDPNSASPLSEEAGQQNQDQDPKMTASPREVTTP